MIIIHVVLKMWTNPRFAKLIYNVKSYHRFRNGDNTLLNLG